MDFIGEQNLNNNELQNFVVHSGTPLPVSTPVPGQLFFETSLAKLYVGTSGGGSIYWYDITQAPSDDFLSGTITFYGQVGSSVIPTGYTFYSAAADKFLRCSATVGGGSGLSMHSHPMGHSHYYGGVGTGSNSSGGVPVEPGSTEGWYSVDGHTHAITASWTNPDPTPPYSDGASNLPTYATLKLIKKT